jgi:hypothetical protein
VLDKQTFIVKSLLSLPSNYRVCDPSQKVPIEAKYKTSAGAGKQRATKQTSADKQSSTPSSISILVPPLNPHTPPLEFARVPQRSCQQLLPNTPGPGPRGWLAGGSQQAASGPRGAAARSAGGERASRCVLGEPRYSACRHLISSGPVAVGRRPVCRWSGPRWRRPSKRSALNSFLVRPARERWREAG